MMQVSTKGIRNHHHYHLHLHLHLHLHQPLQLHLRTFLMQRPEDTLRQPNSE